MGCTDWGRGRRTNVEQWREQYFAENGWGAWTEIRNTIGGKTAGGIGKGEPWLLLVVVLPQRVR